ncbi:CbtB domain-containing protein [Tropicimonas isoalkanivorans]|uniref:Cobalt transporter subunit CbtB n=1 Tax=Tropicimonas isoalkanivorans TaxID=441112 RepID=A0A1I1MNF1_9RHOB|nr:CbtB domain-containing protein [Tropicimonas isoalkanivorans]SFC86881.1 cobalt transporter subunit CbtB [Tropicimonas isoalkanivorans]
MITALRQKALPDISSRRMTVFVCGILGLALITVAGNVQASALHAAAHDVRHANGFVCH